MTPSVRGRVRERRSAVHRLARRAAALLTGLAAVLLAVSFVGLVDRIESAPDAEAGRMALKWLVGNWPVLALWAATAGPFAVVAWLTRPPRP